MKSATDLEGIPVPGYDTPEARESLQRLLFTSSGAPVGQPQSSTHGSNPDRAPTRPKRQQGIDRSLVDTYLLPWSVARPTKGEEVPEPEVWEQVSPTRHRQWT